MLLKKYFGIKLLQYIGWKRLYKLYYRQFCNLHKKGSITQDRKIWLLTKWTNSFRKSSNAFGGLNDRFPTLFRIISTIDKYFITALLFPLFTIHYGYNKMANNALKQYAMTLKSRSKHLVILPDVWHGPIMINNNNVIGISSAIIMSKYILCDMNEAHCLMNSTWCLSNKEFLLNYYEKEIKPQIETQERMMTKREKLRFERKQLGKEISYLSKKYSTQSDFNFNVKSDIFKSKLDDIIDNDVNINTSIDDSDIRPKRRKSFRSKKKTDDEIDDIGTSQTLEIETQIEKNVNVESKIDDNDYHSSKTHDSDDYNRRSLKNQNRGGISMEDSNNIEKIKIAPKKRKRKQKKLENVI